MASPSQNEVTQGQIRPQTSWGEYNQIFFTIQQALSKMQTATLVRVEKCTNAGDLSPVGFVDIMPLVNQVGGNGEAVPHATIYNVPYLRIQGGANAIILDPQPGDIGMAVFASRDLSKVKATKNRSNPGSARQYSFSDALYCGGMLNGTPSQYVQFSATGIKIHSPVAVTLEAPTVSINAGALLLHASERYAWDVAGFGEQWKFLGGITWEHQTWQSGAVINPIVGPINPPNGTP